MEHCYKNISEKIRNVTFIFQNFQKLKRNEEIYMDYEKINKFI